MHERTTHYSYSADAVPPRTADQPFFLAGKVPCPATPEKPNSLSPEILQHWDAGEESLVRIAQETTRSEAFQALLDYAARGGLLELADIRDSFELGFCKAIDVRRARKAIGVGKDFKNKRDGSTKWQFTEEELAQVMVAVVIKKTCLRTKPNP